jgi:hypothetical protein
MAQIFHRSFNTISKATIFGAVFIAGGLGWFMAVFYRSSYVTESHIAYVQPVPFSHQHHAGQLGIDCRYCHTSVEESSFAGIPPTKTCMNCHQQIWVGAELLEPVRQSFSSGQSIRWQRVHNLPGFVYFDHSIHIHKGVGCTECHGRVDQMPLMWQENTLLMEWCLECHRQPTPHLRPRDEVFNMGWTPDELAQRTDLPEPTQEGLARLYKVRSPREITSCSTCHR